MQDLNLVVLKGRIVQDAELKEVSETAKVARFSVASHKRWKDKEGADQESVGFFDVEAWNGLAGVAEEFVKKGRKILVEGSLKQNTWEQDGQKRSRVLVVAKHLDIDLPRKDE